MTNIEGMISRGNAARLIQLLGESLALGDGGIEVIVNANTGNVYVDGLLAATIRKD